MNFFTRRKNQKEAKFLSKDKSTRKPRCNSASNSELNLSERSGSETTSTSTSGSDSEEKHEPLSPTVSPTDEASGCARPPGDEPHGRECEEDIQPLKSFDRKPKRRSPGSSDGMNLLHPVRVSRESPPSADDNNVPIRERVEQEKLRLSLAGSEERSGPVTTSRSLSFEDTAGRSIAYVLKPSKKKTCATFLEMSVEGEMPRKVRNIVYDDACHCIQDRRTKFLIPSSDVVVVMRSLKLLCKISAVKLECVHGSPGMKRVQSNLDFTHGPTGMKNAPSSNSLNSLSNSTVLPKSSNDTLERDVGRTEIKGSISFNSLAKMRSSTSTNSLASLSSGQSRQPSGPKSSKMRGSVSSNNLSGLSRSHSRGQLSGLAGLPRNGGRGPSSSIPRNSSRGSLSGIPRNNSGGSLSSARSNSSRDHLPGLPEGNGQFTSGFLSSRCR